MWVWTWMQIVTWLDGGDIQQWGHNSILFLFHTKTDSWLLTLINQPLGARKSLKSCFSAGRRIWQLLWRSSRCFIIYYQAEVCTLLNGLLVFIGILAWKKASLTRWIQFTGSSLRKQKTRTWTDPDPRENRSLSKSNWGKCTSTLLMSGPMSNYWTRGLVRMRK